MLVTFWGVRGSTPVPGPTTLRRGGNTSCVTVESGGHVLVIDAGTGIRNLGRSLIAAESREIFLLLTHLHGDHIIGFPFFSPLFRADASIRLIDYTHDGRGYSLLELFDGRHVPMRSDQLAADCARTSTERGLAMLAACGFEIATLPLNHPGGALAYRVTVGGRSFVHITDNELGATGGPTSFEAFAEFCAEADLLSHDAQWLDTETAARRGWGHSSVTEACDLAAAAGARRLVLFHHDPDRDDDAIDRLEAEAAQRLSISGIPCVAAAEGLRVEL